MAVPPAGGGARTGDDEGHDRGGAGSVSGLARSLRRRLDAAVRLGEGAEGGGEGANGRGARADGRGKRADARRAGEGAREADPPPGPAEAGVQGAGALRPGVRDRFTTRVALYLAGGPERRVALRPGLSEDVDLLAGAGLRGPLAEAALALVRVEARGEGDGESDPLLGILAERLTDDESGGLAEALGCRGPDRGIALAEAERMLEELRDRLSPSERPPGSPRRSR